MKSNLRRSMLYVPGDSRKMLQKSTMISSDVLLLNLEDGVASSQKNIARENIAESLKNANFGKREIVVRINPLDTETGLLDLAAIVPLRPDGICLPKVENTSQVIAADRAIRELETKHDMPEESIWLHAMIESAGGLLHSSEIALSSRRMASLIFGSADYVNDVRCQPGADRQELLLALQLIVLSARSAGIDAIDGPCFDVRNQDLLHQEAAQARRLGFDGKSALHPDQLAVINQVFDVTLEEIAWAERAIAELDAAENRGKALTTVEGKLLDNPHRAAAERILSRQNRQKQIDKVFTDLK
jgi:citrate lyase subunit beta / citryl-CoA lyase